ncbi:Uncharacterised protein [Mycobacterium tuberculosis]|nr:Uncharacterised protein [Mycobacterium tuberculosis]
MYGGLDDGDVDATLTRTGGHFQAYPAGTHHCEGRPLHQNGVQCHGVVVAAQVVDAGGIGSRYWWAPWGRSRGQQQLVVAHRSAVGKLYRVCGPIQ